MSVYSIDKLMSEARRLAKDYRAATGKTLPITGEIAVNDAIRVLQMDAATEPGLGYEAIFSKNGINQRVQVKGRAIFNNKRSGHRLGQLKLEQEWDAIILLIMDEDYESREIYIANKESILDAVNNSKNKRGSISVARFRNIGELIWTAENGLEDDGYWSKQDQ